MIVFNRDMYDKMIQNWPDKIPLKPEFKEFSHDRIHLCFEDHKHDDYEDPFYIDAYFRRTIDMYHVLIWKLTINVNTQLMEEIEMYKKVS